MLLLIALIVIVAVTLLLVLNHERTERRIKHRAGTLHLLSYIAGLPLDAASRTVR